MLRLFQVGKCLPPPPSRGKIMPDPNFILYASFTTLLPGKCSRLSGKCILGKRSMEGMGNSKSFIDHHYVMNTLIIEVKLQSWNNSLGQSWKFMRMIGLKIKNMLLNYKLLSCIDLNFTLSLPLTPTDQCWSCTVFFCLKTI